MADRTKVISVHRFRRVARGRERALQGALELGGIDGGPESVRRLGLQTSYTTAAEWPKWAHGVRVESAGRFQHAVVATEHRGH